MVLVLSYCCSTGACQATAVLGGASSHNNAWCVTWCVELLMMLPLGLLWLFCVVGHGAMVGTPELPGHACDCRFVCIITEPWWALAKGALIHAFGCVSSGTTVGVVGLVVAACRIAGVGFTGSNTSNVSVTAPRDGAELRQGLPSMARSGHWIGHPSLVGLGAVSRAAGEADCNMPRVCALVVAFPSMKWPCQR